jgi:hypothetical protein
VNTYILYVYDDRYSVPNLDAISVDNDTLAIAMAEHRLASSHHYRAVEVWEDERPVCRIERDGLNAAKREG